MGAQDVTNPTKIAGQFIAAATIHPNPPVDFILRSSTRRRKTVTILGLALPRHLGIHSSIATVPSQAELPQKMKVVIPLDRTQGSLAPTQSTRIAILFVATFMGIAFLLMSGSYWPNGEWAHETIQWVGFALVFLCIFGRTWSSMYIGGLKNRKLVTDGPYSVCRNPLYLFSIIGAVGVGAEVGSIVIALICGIFAWVIFLLTAKREEPALLATFGDEYRRYCARVPRFIPKWSLWHGPDTIEVRPKVVIRTFLHALAFFIATPVAEGIDYLHAFSGLPVFIVLP
jgi:protein-S-isoprenylcysteine O-methyltransferase Ste14